MATFVKYPPSVVLDVTGLVTSVNGQVGAVVLVPHDLGLGPTDSVTFGNITDNGLTANRAVATDSGKMLVSSATTDTELGFVNGVTSSIQTQLNSKQTTITPANLTDAGTDGIVVTGGTNSVLTAVSLAQHVADTTHNGYLSSTDWNTFNSKQAAGNYITALTGDVTATGPGSVASTVAKIQGKTVSGTTGTTNVVFSASPTFTGTPLTTNLGVTNIFADPVGAHALITTGGTGGITLHDSNGLDSVSWDARNLHRSNLSESVDWDQSILFDEGTTPTVYWGNTLLPTSGLLDPSTNILLGWSAAGVSLPLLTPSTALALNASNIIVSSTTTLAELAFVHGVTSSIQTQLNAKAPTASPTFTGAVTINNGRLVSTQTTVPTTTTNANAGTGATSSVAHATDTAGVVNLTLGSIGTLSSGVQVTVNFNVSYPVAPIVTLTPTNAITASNVAVFGVYISSTTAGFSINFATAGVATDVLQWNYHAIGTQ